MVAASCLLPSEVASDLRLLVLLLESPNLRFLALIELKLVLMLHALESAFEVLAFVILLADVVLLLVQFLGLFQDLRSLLLLLLVVLQDLSTLKPS